MDTDRITKRGRGYLPHWEAEGASYFVTFRLAGSLPRSALVSLEAEVGDIVKTAKQQRRELTDAERRRVGQLRAKRIEQALDAGAGACYLFKAEVADVVMQGLQHFDGKWYRLIAWCVMPNHVHVVLQMLGLHTLAEVLHSWKSFTAKRANAILGRSRQFWQREYYDHLVRNGEQLDRAVRYVAENPRRAGLKDWKWVWTVNSAAVPAACRQDAGATTTNVETHF